MVLAGTKVTSLQNGLNVIETSGSLGEGEIRRRRDLIRELNTEISGLERLSQAIATQRTTLSVPNANNDQHPNPLFIQHSPAPVSTRRVFGAPPPETERTKGLDNEGILQLQHQILKEQDDQMDDFLRQVCRTKGVAEQIQEELQSHVDLLGGLEEDLDRVEGKIKRASKRADKLS